MSSDQRAWEAGIPLHATSRIADRRAAAGVLGLSLPQWWLCRLTPGTGGGAAAKNVLVFLEQGGLSHFDTWDPKRMLLLTTAARQANCDQHAGDAVHLAAAEDFTSRRQACGDPLDVACQGGGQWAPGRDSICAVGIASPHHPLEMPDIGCIATKLLGSACRELPPYIHGAGGITSRHASTRTGSCPQLRASSRQGP